jgi:hypothetical protein
MYEKLIRMDASCLGFFFHLAHAVLEETGGAAAPLLST